MQLFVPDVLTDLPVTYQSCVCGRCGPWRDRVWSVEGPGVERQRSAERWLHLRWELCHVSTSEAA